MNKSRLEAFSDGVIAIIITIMVLEIKPPGGATWDALESLTTVFISYILSFAFVGVYWVNHHHLLQVVKKINSGMMWANINLLFWLSLIPFATAWMGEEHFVPFTVAIYAVLLLVCGIAFTILQKIIEKNITDKPTFKKAMQRLDKKGLISLIGYSSSIPLAYVHPAISGVLFILIALIWFIPDKNIEKAFSEG